MNQLLTALHKRQDTHKIWYSNEQWQSLEKITNLTHRVLTSISSDNIALAFSQDEELALGMLAAHGHCKRVLLVPSSWNNTVLNKYLKKADIKHVLTTRSDLQSPYTVLLDIKDNNKRVLNIENNTSSETRWIIPTSGTTGQPKLVEHTLKSLTRTVKNNQEKGKEFTWGMLYEIGRFAGLQVFLQAILGGSKLIFTKRDANHKKRLEPLINAECNALSATPTFWRRLMMEPSSSNLPLRLITLGGEIADANILSALSSRYPDAKIIHIYASTEAGVGFSVSDCKEGFPINYIKTPPPKIEIKVDDHNILWLRPMDANQKFLGESIELSDTLGWINTGDQVSKKGDRYTFSGRANGTINVGGNKVFPEEVENIIREVNGVLLVVVRALPNPFTGSLVEADIQTKNNIDLVALKHKIKLHCKRSLAPFMVPAKINWVNDIKTNEAGKVIRS